MNNDAHVTHIHRDICNMECRRELYSRVADDLVDELLGQLRKEQLVLTSTRSFAFWRMMQMHRGWRTVFSQTSLFDECLERYACVRVCAGLTKIPCINQPCPNGLWQAVACVDRWVNVLQASSQCLETDRDATDQGIMYRGCWVELQGNMRHAREMQLVWIQRMIREFPKDTTPKMVSDWYNGTFAWTLEWIVRVCRMFFSDKVVVLQEEMTDVPHKSVMFLSCLPDGISVVTPLETYWTICAHAPWFGRLYHHAPKHV